MGEFIAVMMAAAGFVAVIMVFVVIVKQFLYVGRPNEILIFSGRDRLRADGSHVGFRTVIGGRTIKIPILETVNRMDLRVIPVTISIEGAYSQGGIPLNVHAIANVKLSSDPDKIDNAIERFLGRDRNEVARVARETLEGNLRGVLANLTPEQVNEDRAEFAKSLFAEAMPDLRSLGLELDTLKVQSVSDDKGYLDSIGRRQSAELIRESRIAEATNRAEASVLDASNQLKKAVAKINAQKNIATAEAQRRITDAQTKSKALVAEERSKIGAAIAKSMANIDVQRARIEQVKRQLEADVIRPAHAKKSELELQARANVAKTIEEGRANAEALRSLLQVWHEAGDAARPIFLIQQFDAILNNMLSTIQDIKIDKITVIDSRLEGLDRNAAPAIKAASASEQIKQTMDLDLPRLLQGVAALSNK